MWIQAVYVKLLLAIPLYEHAAVCLFNLTLVLTLFHGITHCNSHVQASLYKGVDVFPGSVPESELGRAKGPAPSWCY